MNPGELLHMAGYAVGGIVFFLAARQRKMATEGIGLLVAAGLFGSVIGARLTQYLVDLPLSTSFGLAGKSLAGGILGGWLAVVLAKKALGIQRSTGDLFALALPAGEAVGRIGCHLNPCCIGKPYEGAFCVIQVGASRVPVQLLSAVVCAVIFASLLWARPKMKREGKLFLWFILLESTSRFALEFLREPSGPMNGLSAMQWVCLVGVGYAVVKLHKPSEVPLQPEIE